MKNLNKLYYGDNLDVMKEKIECESVDLIYLDPPFNSARNYNVMYTTMTGMPVSEQEEAFCDTWTMDPKKIDKMHNMKLIMQEYGIEDPHIQFWDAWLPALRHTQPALLSYMVYMVERLLEMKRILKPTGSIYLHCDSTASHYIKLMMDTVFGHNNFRNEIIWKRTTGKNDAKRKFGSITDTIFFYTKGDKYSFKPQYYWDEEYQKYLDKTYRHLDETGRKYAITPLDSPSYRPNLMYDYKGYKPPEKGWRISRAGMEQLDAEGRLAFPKSLEGRIQKKRYIDEVQGKLVQSLWEDIQRLSSHSKERLGYPTQKPVALLERIIQASCPEGGIVFDPFCGCGTTINAALKNNRQWIGCDIAILPVKLIKEQLISLHRLKENKHFEIDGIPVSYEQADLLMSKDPHQFQHWLVEQVGGFPTVKKSNDKGIDGRLYIKTSEGLKDMVLSVKGGKTVMPTDIRDLRGVLEREHKAVMAGFLSLKKPTEGMYNEAAQAGMWEHEGVKYPKIQLLHVQEILSDGKMFQTPSRVGIKIASKQMTLGL